MTRPINVEATQQEQRIEEALKGVQSGHYKSLREAAQQLKIPRSTLTLRYPPITMFELFRWCEGKVQVVQVSI